MKIHVRAVGIELNAKVRAEIERRLHSSLDRLAHHLLRVAVRVSDQNGPRGGEDISCLIEMRLRPRGRLFVQEADLDVMGAVGQAADSAATSLVRTVERSRDLRRRPSADPALGASGI
jgi:ribosome-associated translation inhibitor RaiA